MTDKAQPKVKYACKKCAADFENKPGPTVCPKCNHLYVVPRPE